MIRILTLMHWWIARALYYLLKPLKAGFQWKPLVGDVEGSNGGMCT